MTIAILVVSPQFHHCHWRFLTTASFSQSSLWSSWCRRLSTLPEVGRRSHSLARCCSPSHRSHQPAFEKMFNCSHTPATRFEEIANLIQACSTSKGKSWKSSFYGQPVFYFLIVKTHFISLWGVSKKHLASLPLSDHLWRSSSSIEKLVWWKWLGESDAFLPEHI